MKKLLTVLLMSMMTLSSSVALAKSDTHAKSDTQVVIACVRYDHIQDIVDAESYVIFESADGTKNDLEVFENGCVVHENTHGWWESFTLKYVINGIKNDATPSDFAFTAGVGDGSEFLVDLLYITEAELTMKFDVSDAPIILYNSNKLDSAKQLKAIFKVKTCITC